jgi:ribosomal protein S19E (S16A)
MGFYPNGASCTLSDSHRRMLFAESGVSPEVAGERGYYTARRGSEVPEVFSKYQRRPGLVVPMYSPDGETVGYQLRPDRPRKDGPKYQTPASISPVVDVHPRMLEEVRHGTSPLLVTEGAKTGDAATSCGVPTVVLAGVWMWCVPKVKPYRLKPCFDHIALEGRDVFVAFDSDCMSKAGVQEALAALVAALKGRGAVVQVVYLPNAPDGSKQGVDDFLAAGGTIREMFMLAREFDPADVGRIRLSRDQKLQAAVEDLQRRWWDEEWKGRGGHTERDVALKLIEAAARSGKVHPDGIRVHVSWGVLQVGAKVARRTLSKAIARLEERGFLYRDNEGRKVGKSGAFVLRAKVDHEGRGAAQVTPELQTCGRSGLPLRGVPDVTRLRWSQSKWTPKTGLVSGTRKVRESPKPEPRSRIERLGKVRGAVTDVVQVAGGLSVPDLSEALHYKRPRDVRRRILPMLEEAGVIEVVDDVVRLAADWSERLEAARIAGGELEADELAERRRKLNSAAYHRRHHEAAKPDDPPPLMGAERVAEMLRENRADRAATKTEEMRRAEAFVRSRLALLGRIRLVILEGAWHDKGGDPRHIPQAAAALGCRVEKLPEFQNRRFVFPPAEAA